MREEYGPYSAADPSLRVYLDLLKRRRLMIASVVVVFLTLAVTYIILAPRVYRSESQMAIDAGIASVVRKDMSDPYYDAYSSPSDADIPTQIQIVQSPLVFNRVCNVTKVPGDEVTFKAERSYDSNVLNLSVSSGNPDYATKVAKAYPQVYLDYVRDTRNGDLVRSRDYTALRLQGEQQALDRSESALEGLKRRTNIADLNRAREVAITSSADLSTSAIKSEIELRGLQSQLSTLQQLRRSTPTMVSTPTTSTNARIDALQQKLQDLTAEREKTLVQYKPEHPKVQLIDSQIAALQRQIDAQPKMVTSVTRTVNPDIDVLDKQIADLKARISQSQAQVNRSRAVSQMNAGQVGKFASFERIENQLQRSIGQHKDNVDMLSKSLSQLNIRLQATHMPVRLITPAEDAELVSPKPFNALAAALLLGLFFGVAGAMAKEYFDSRIYSWEKARRILGAPVLGFVPSIEAGQRMLGNTKDQEVLQSYRVLRTNVQFGGLREGMRSIFFTATLPGEGKTTTALNYATSVAMDGKTVLIIDADLMNPNVHKDLKLERSPGLTDVLKHEISLTDAIRSTEQFGLRVLSAGTSVSNGTELLNSHQMKDLLQEAREFFDVVVIDGPSTLSGADALITASIADGTIFVVQPGKVKEPSLHYAVHLLRQARANLVGVVFNQVDDKAMESAFYYGAHSDAYGVFKGLPAWQTPELPSKAIADDADKADPTSTGFVS